MSYLISLNCYFIAYMISYVPTLFVVYYNIDKRIMYLTNLLFLIIFYYLNYNKTKKNKQINKINKKLLYLNIIHGIIFWITFIFGNITLYIQHKQFSELNNSSKTIYLFFILLISILDRFLLYNISLYFYNIINGKKEKQKSNYSK